MGASRNPRRDRPAPGALRSFPGAGQSRQRFLTEHPARRVRKACVHTERGYRMARDGGMRYRNNSRGLAAIFDRLSFTASISDRIEIIASQKRSSSAFDSDSVGSIIRVPGTGKLMVGAWNP